MNIHKFITSKAFFIFILFGLFGCSDNHEHKANISGEELYIEHCAGCHKASGEGKFLKGVPSNKYTHLTAEEIIDKITGNGAKKTKMKIFQSMSKEEAQIIALYVKNTLKEQ